MWTVSRAEAGAGGGDSGVRRGRRCLAGGRWRGREPRNWSGVGRAGGRIRGCAELISSQKIFMAVRRRGRVAEHAEQEGRGAAVGRQAVAGLEVLDGGDRLGRVDAIGGAGVVAVAAEVAAGCRGRSGCGWCRRRRWVWAGDRVARRRWAPGRRRWAPGRGPRHRVVGEPAVGARSRREESSPGGRSTTEACAHLSLTRRSAWPEREWCSMGRPRVATPPWLHQRSGMPQLTLHNSMTRRREDFTPIDPAHVRCTCAGRRSTIWRISGMRGR